LAQEFAYDNNAIFGGDPIDSKAGPSTYTHKITPQVAIWSQVFIYLHFSMLPKSAEEGSLMAQSTYIH
jgi:hypothetical protein